MVKNVVTPASTSVLKFVLFSLSLNKRSSKPTEGLGVVISSPYEKIEHFVILRSCLQATLKALYCT